MTLLDKRDAEIVKLNRVDGLSHRAVARQVQVSASTVTRVVGAFKEELTVVVGPLCKRTPAFLRDITVQMLTNAATYCRPAAAA